MSDILSYKELQEGMLYYYPIYCRSKLRGIKKFGKGWVEGELEVGYALNEMEGSFKEPVEEFMFYVAALILMAGRESKYTYDAIAEVINKFIADHGLINLLAQLSEADAKRVRSDLELLELI
ncbi:hypothetical protein [Pseudomonas vanderleydeniana]|uniref:Uncharacterized protein n=1 Tax=Pseudomonas vanderleydeniana TaxID=2745495 RepID=A0A9E6TQ91_9PSED|nr:hypothetical protein [Pseudomonas vanderleydeniana]QXI26202.1 hypothetical protein HU752_019825 [Pseudomonas vanderleydeniana]